MVSDHPTFKFQFWMRIVTVTVLIDITTNYEGSQEEISVIIEIKGKSLCLKMHYYGFHPLVSLCWLVY